MFGNKLIYKNMTQWGPDLLIYGRRKLGSLEMGRHAYERSVAKSPSVRSLKQKLHRIPSGLPSESVPGMDGLLI